MKAVVEERFPLLVFDCAAPFDVAQDKLRQAQSGSGFDSPFDFAQGMAQPIAQTT